LATKLGNVIRQAAGGIGGDIQYSLGGFWAKGVSMYWGLGWGLGNDI